MTAVRMAPTLVVTLAAFRLHLPRPLDRAVIVGMALRAFGNAFGRFNQPVWQSRGWGSARRVHPSTR